MELHKGVNTLSLTSTQQLLQEEEPVAHLLLKSACFSTELDEITISLMTSVLCSMKQMRIKTLFVQLNRLSKFNFIKAEKLRYLYDGKCFV